MLAFIAYAIAAVLLVVAAEGGRFVTDNPGGWGLAFIAIGLALQAMPGGASGWRKRLL